MALKKGDTFKHFSKQEISFLINNYKDMSFEEMGKVLNRSTKSISVKCSKLKIGNKRFPVQVGERFDRLIVIERTNRRGKDGKVYFDCLCDCGNKIQTSGCCLRTGDTKSCGCLRIEKFKLVGKLRRLEIGESSFNMLESSYKASARRRKIEYDLSKEKFRELVKQNCYWCGSRPIPHNRYYGKDSIHIKKLCSISEEWASQQWIYVNGIDRVDNERGYLTDNTVPCCWECNDMKATSTAEEFITHSYKIVAFQESKKLK